MQDLVVPSGGVQQCIMGPSNPYALLLMPVPSAHFHVCGQTSACRLRCAKEWSLFDIQVAQATGAVTSPPQFFATSVESPLFNVYGTSSAIGGVTDRVIGLVRGGPVCSMCSSDCVSVLTIPWSFDASESWAAVQIAGYCVPEPSSLTSYVYRSQQPPVIISAPAFVAGAGAGAAELKFADFSRQPSYVVLGFDITTTLALTDPKTQKTTAVSETAHVLYVVVKGAPQLVVHTLALQSQILTSAMQLFLFGGSAPAGVSVSGLAINNLLEVFTNTTGKLTFFMEISFVMRYPENAAPSEDVQPSVVHAIATWCDSAVQGCKSGVQYFAPCASCSVSDHSSVKLSTMPADARGDVPTCKLGLSLALRLSSEGALLHISDSLRYVHVPNTDNLQPLRQWTISPDGSATTYYAPNVCSTSNSQTGLADTLGTWSGTNVFTGGALDRPVIYCLTKA